MKNTTTRYLATGALIAALYAAITYAGGALAYGQVQFRFSEALCVLPVFTPAAIPGLTIGCLIANIGSFNALDMLFGTAATLLSALCSRALRNRRTFGLPLLSLLPPVLINAVIVGAEITLWFTDAAPSLTGFVIAAAWVGLGELTVCFGLGLPLYLLLNKYKSHLFRESY